MCRNAVRNWRGLKRRDKQNSGATRGWWCLKIWHPINRLHQQANRCRKWKRISCKRWQRVLLRWPVARLLSYRFRNWLNNPILEIWDCSSGLRKPSSVCDYDWGAKIGWVRGIVMIILRCTWWWSCTLSKLSWGNGFFEVVFLHSQTGAWFYNYNSCLCSVV